MQESITEALRIAEKLRLRADALSGAAAGISAASRQAAMTADEIYQLLDVIADDMKRQADRLIEKLAGEGGSRN